MEKSAASQAVDLDECDGKVVSANIQPAILYNAFTSIFWLKELLFISLHNRFLLFFVLDADMQASNCFLMMRGR